MSRSISTKKQKRKLYKKARRINRTKKHKRRHLNPFNSKLARKAAQQRKNESKKHYRESKKRDKSKRYAMKILSSFEGDIINEIAIAAGFLTRKSKITPICFLSTLILSYISSGDKAFGLMATNLESWFGISVSVQAISERLKHKKTAKFFKECFSLYLNQKLEPYISQKGYSKQLGIFKGIKIGDSTSIELSESLAKNFKGSGGGASKSALKLNFLMDVFSSTTTKIDVKKGSYSDRNFAEQAVRYLKRGELLIRDLGYFSLDAFKAIIAKGAFYISRLQKGVKIYLTDCKEPVEIGDFLKKHTCNGKKIIDQQVFVGHQKLPSRLIAFKTPKWVVKQRLKKFKAMHKKEPGEEYITWSGYSVFITNIDSTVCSAELIVELYTIRWQMELIFKCYKSTLKLDIIRGTSRNSVLCIVYAKLIGILITEKIIFFAAAESEENGRELSVDKTTKWLKNGNKLVLAILNGEMDRLLFELTCQLKYLYKDKRKQKPSTYKKVCDVCQEPKNSFLHQKKDKKQHNLNIV